MKKVTALLLALGSGFFGCATAQHITPKDFTRTYEPVDSKGFGFENNDLSFEFTPETANTIVSMKFLNKSKEPIHVVWDETVFINDLGESEKLIHEGVKLIDRDKSMSASVIPPGLSLRDAAGPASRVTRTRYGWDKKPICGNYTVESALVFHDETCVGKTFGFFVAYEVNGKKKNFTVKYKYVSRKSNREIASVKN